MSEESKVADIQPTPFAKAQRDIRRAIFTAQEAYDQKPSEIVAILDVMKVEFAPRDRGDCVKADSNIVDSSIHNPRDCACRAWWHDANRIHATGHHPDCDGRGGRKRGTKIPYEPMPPPDGFEWHADGYGNPVLRPTASETTDHEFYGATEFDFCLICRVQGISHPPYKPKEPGIIGKIIAEGYHGCCVSAPHVGEKCAPERYDHLGYKWTQVDPNVPTDTPQWWQVESKPDLQLLVIDLGDSCVVKVEKDDRKCVNCGVRNDAPYLCPNEGEGKHIWATDFPRLIFGDGSSEYTPGIATHHFHRSFADVRAAIEALEGEPPVPGILPSRPGAASNYVFLVPNMGNDARILLSQSDYEALSKFAGKPLPVFTEKKGTWKRLPDTSEYMGDPLESAGIKIWRYTK